VFSSQISAQQQKMSCRSWLSLRMPRWMVLILLSIFLCGISNVLLEWRTWYHANDLVSQSSTTVTKRPAVASFSTTITNASTARDIPPPMVANTTTTTITSYTATKHNTISHTITNATLSSSHYITTATITTTTITPNTSVTPTIQALIHATNASFRVNHQNTTTPTTSTTTKTTTTTQQPPFSSTINSPLSPLSTSPLSQSPSPMWIPVTDPDELRLYIPCNHTFRHCCIGQNRRYTDIRHDMTPLLTQWHTPLPSMMDLLESLSRHQKRRQQQQQHPTQQQQQHEQQQSTQQQQQSTFNNNIYNDSDSSSNSNSDSFCNVWMIGDSTSSDYTMGAMCELTRKFGYRIIDCVPGYGGPTWGEDELCQTLGNPSIRMYNFTHLWLQHPHSHATVACPNVILRLDFGFSVEDMNIFGNDNPPAEQAFLDQGGLVVWSWGAHCRAPGCITSLMHTYFRPFVEQRHAQWMIQWREMEPQHFNTSDGVHTSDPARRQGRSHCVPHRPYAYNNYCNDEARAFLSEFNNNHSYRHHHDGDDDAAVVVGGGGDAEGDDAASNTLVYIPLIPVMDVLASRWDLHTDELYDCTHYVYTPWRFPIVWDRIIKAMDSLH
jgi:hypothetical protein